MTSTIYPSPIAQLITFGDPRDQRDWRDYLALGLTLDHVPDLIRLMLDEDLRWADGESPEIWAGLHAWRALGQLHAEAAIPALIGMLPQADDDESDDWVDGDFPKVLALIGPTAIPALTLYLANLSHGLYSRACVANSLKEMAKHHPAHRSDCVAALVRQLDTGLPNETNYQLNGFVIGDLLDLEAVEAAPAIERAFKSGSVDEPIAGDWEDAQIALGLKIQREHPINYQARSKAGRALEEMRAEIRQMPAFQDLAKTIANTPLPPLKKSKGYRRKKKK